MDLLKVGDIVNDSYHNWYVKIEEIESDLAVVSLYIDNRFVKYRTPLTFLEPVSSLIKELL